MPIGTFEYKGKKYSERFRWIRDIFNGKYLQASRRIPELCRGLHLKVFVDFNEIEMYVRDASNRLESYYEKCDSKDMDFMSDLVEECSA